MTPLYQRMLRTAWPSLPQEVRDMHQWTGSLNASGMARVERGSGPLSRGIGGLFGFPAPGENMPLTVRFTTSPEGERWERDFAGQRFVSVQSEGRGRNTGLLLERFGPFRIALALVVKDAQLHLMVRGWSLFGVPLPRFLAPGGVACESVEDGRFNFHVEIRAPLAGLLVRYRGWLVPDLGAALDGAESASQSSHSRPSR